MKNLAPLRNLVFTLQCIIILVASTIPAHTQETIAMVSTASKQPIVSGKINGRKCYFLIDTGSGISIIHKGLNRKFNLSFNEMRNKDYQLSGLGYSHKGEILVARGVKVHMGNTRLKTEFLVFDLSNIVRSIFDTRGVRISGIIGSDLMRKYAFSVDFGLDQISICQQ